MVCGSCDLPRMGEVRLDLRMFMERSTFVIQLQREAIYRKLCVFFVKIENSPLLAILAHFSDRKQSITH